MGIAHDCRLFKSHRALPPVIVRTRRQEVHLKLSSSFTADILIQLQNKLLLELKNDMTVIFCFSFDFIEMPILLKPIQSLHQCPVVW